MVTPTAAFMAEAVSIDAFSGRLTAFNMLDSVYTPRLPAMFGKLVVVATYPLGSDAEAFHEKISLVGPDDNPVFTSQTRVELVARTAGAVPNMHRSIHMFWSTRFDQFGDHSLVIEHAATADGPWHEVARRIVTVICGLLPGQPEPPAPRSDAERETGRELEK